MPDERWMTARPPYTGRVPVNAAARPRAARNVSPNDLAETALRRLSGLARGPVPGIRSGARRWPRAPWGQRWVAHRLGCAGIVGRQLVYQGRVRRAVRQVDQ